MNLQQFIEVKKAEFDEKFPPQGNHAFRINVNLKGEQATDFLSAALREAVTQALNAVRVEKDGYSCYECGSEGFNAAVEAQEKKINDYLK